MSTDAKDTSFAETLKALSDAKNELKSREEGIRQLHREVSLLDNEKRLIQQKLKQVENVLGVNSR